MRFTDDRGAKRTPQGIVPTPAGRALLVRARAIQAELRKAEEEMAQLAGSDVGSVAFGVGPLAAALIVPDAIRQFREQFRDSRIRIVERYAPALIAQVRDESLDFALGPRFETTLDPAIAFRPLFREQWVVVARRGHPLTSARSLAQLVDVEWLRVGSGSPGGWLEPTFAAAALPLPRRLISCDSMNVLVGVLTKTDMVGMLGAHARNARSRRLASASARARAHAGGDHRHVHPCGSTTHVHRYCHGEGSHRGRTASRAAFIAAVPSAGIQLSGTRKKDRFGRKPISLHDPSHLSAAPH